jgi:O-antigen ligase
MGFSLMRPRHPVLASERGHLAMLGADEAVYAVLVIVGLVLWLSESLALTVALIGFAALISTISPVGVFWACLAALPLVYHPISIRSASITLLELGILLATAGLCVRVLLDGNQFQFSAWTSPNEIRWVWLGAMTVLIAGALAIGFQPDHDHIRESLRTYRWVIVEAVAAFVLARYAMAQRGGERVLFALVIPAVGISVWAIAEVVSGRSRFEVDSVSRATASYRHPNSLALYLIRIFIVLLCVTVLTGPGRRRRFWLAATGLTGIALAATLSRGALVGTLAGMLVIAWFAQRKLVAVAAGCAIVALPITFLLLAQERFFGDESSGIGETRLKIWSSSVEIIRDYPISGIGLDQFLYHHNPRYIDPSIWSERYISHPHNLLLDSWLSLGWPGALLLVAGVIALVQQARSVRRRGYDGAWWQPAAIVALAAGLAHSLFDNGYFLPDLAVLTWILIALSLGPVCSERAGTGDSEMGPFQPERTEHGC